jgi:hypothetical protein
MISHGVRQGSGAVFIARLILRDLSPFPRNKDKKGELGI